MDNENMPKKPYYSPAQRELVEIKMALGKAKRIAVAATVLAGFQDIPQLRGVSAELTLTLKEHLRGLQRFPNG